MKIIRTTDGGDNSIKFKIGWTERNFSTPNLWIEIEEELNQVPTINFFIGEKIVASSDWDNKGSISPEVLKKAIDEYFKTLENYKSKQKKDNKKIKSWGKQK